MSPALDMPLNRRDVLMAIGALFATAMGWHTLVAETDATEPLQLEREPWHGMPAPSFPLLSANLLSTYGLSEDEWKAALRESVRLADELGMGGVRSHFADIMDRARALECPVCYGVGFHRDRNSRRVDCRACNGTGRKDGGR